MMYAVVLTVAGKAKTGLAELRTRFGAHMKYTIEPHVTIKYPFTLRADIGIILNKLNEVAGHAKPFVMVLDGMRYWEGPNNVAYVAVKNRKAVFDLHSAVTLALQGLTAGDTTYDFQNFTPHLTISEHIPNDILPGVKRELSEHEPKYRVKTTSFALFEAEPSDEWETWKPAGVFRFQNPD